MGRKMGIGVLGGQDICFKRKFRWMFYITNVIGDGANMLPPDKGARPSINFKEIEAQHLNETVYFPGKPDWKPITLTLFDLKLKSNPVFTWLRSQYDVCEDYAIWNRPINDPEKGFKRNARIELYDGCGNIIEKWHVRNVWPNNIEWGDLDMEASSYVSVELTLRYDRAWIENC